MNKLLLVITFGMDGSRARVVSETDFRTELAEGEYGDDPDFRKLDAGDRLDLMSGEKRIVVTEYWPWAPPQEQVQLSVLDTVGWPLVDTKEVSSSLAVHMRGVRKLEPHKGTVPLGYNEPEPPPAPGRADVWPLVLEDMRKRDQEGIAKYGTPLQTHNGRKPLVDAYQEALDLVVYLRQELEERKTGRG